MKMSLKLKLFMNYLNKNYIVFFIFFKFMRSNYNTKIKIKKILYSFKSLINFIP